MKSACLLLPLIVLVLSTPSLATLLHTLSFEGSDRGYSLDGAKITDAPGTVLSGNSSVLADFTSATQEWNEFLATTQEIKFEPGFVYHVSFKYRILDPGKPETRFYSLLRSRSGGDIYGRFWLWNREAGAEGVISRLFKVDEKDDWMLIIGVRHQGSLIIDDVTISRCDEPVPGKGLPVKPGATSLLKIKRELDDARKAEGMDAILRDMLIVWCNEGAGNKIVDRRAEFAAELEPDFVDWNSCGPLAKDFGVRTSTGGPEYQEFYKNEGPDVWDARFQRFVNNGFAVSLDGTLIQDETWGEGGYFTCHNGRGWHEWFIQRLLQMNRSYMGMCQDNIGCATFYKGQGCFCEPCLQKFREWLGSRYNAQELLAFGISDISTFNYRNRVTRYGLIGNQALEDPVTREYIKFQFCSQLEAWADVVRAVKADAVERGFPVPCSGNQIGAFGMWPYAAVVGEFCDIIEIEEVTDAGDSISNIGLHYKIGRAIGHENKPVWVRGPVYDPRTPKTPQMSPLFWQSHFAEALANGGVRDISFGMNSPWTGDPTTLDFIDSPEIQQVWRDYSRLCRENRAIFTNRKSLAKVGLVYSLPTTMYRRFYPLDIDDNGYFSIFDDTSRWLDAMHIPHDCIIFGHSEVFPTATAQLKQYKVLVLPSADALSDTQISLLKDFAARGGIIIKLGELGSRDENLNPRPAGALSGVPVIDLKQEKDKALIKMEAASLVRINAPESVTANLWLSANGASVDLHLVNYSADLAKNVWEFTGPVEVTVELPQGFEFDTARLSRYGRSPVSMDFKRQGNRVSVKVPSLDSYAVISFADSAKLASANTAANARRAQDRDHVKKLAAEKGLY